MKIKMMPMLLTLLVFAAIALCGSPFAQAWECPPGENDDPINVLDNYCSQEEKDRLLCFEAVAGEFPSGYAYVVQVYVNEDIANPIAPVPNSNGEKVIPWPIIYPDQTKEYRYRASVQCEMTDCKGVDTWNYFIQKQSASVADDLLMTDPPGAQLLIPGDSVNKCDIIQAFEGEVLLKLNPSLNCGIGNEVIFSLTYTNDVLIGRCNQSAVLTKSGCGDGGYILGPSPGALPFHAEQKHTFWDGGFIDVVFDSSACNAGDDLVKEVYIDDYVNAVTPTANAWICTPAPDGSTLENPYIAEHPQYPGDSTRYLFCIKPEQAGLQYQGCVIDANPRTYLFGGDVYTRP